MEAKLDRRKRKIEIGDLVVFSPCDESYLYIGTVDGFTATKVKVKCTGDSNGHGVWWKDTTLKFPVDIIVIDR